MVLKCGHRPRQHAQCDNTPAARIRTFIFFSGSWLLASCFPCMQEFCSPYSIVSSRQALRLGAVDHHQVLLLFGHGLSLCPVCGDGAHLCGGPCQTEDSLGLSPAHVHRLHYGLRECHKVSRGFEPRSLDSESRVLAVTPRDQLKWMLMISMWTYILQLR